MISLFANPKPLKFSSIATCQMKSAFSLLGILYPDTKPTTLSSQSAIEQHSLKWVDCNKYRYSEFKSKLPQLLTS